MKRITLFIFTIAMMASCADGAYKSTPDGVVVKVQDKQENGPAKVRLQVMSEGVVRVSQTPDKKFHDRNSLIILPDAQKETDFEVVDSETSVGIKTSELYVTVSKTDGVVTFMDAKGNVISKESEPAYFTPISVTDTKGTTTGYTTINRFNTVPEEGLFGLGQHQSDQWNYKGENEELYQYNTKISIPFVISSKNYGILWDSYSLARFGNPETYSQLHKVFKLYDKNGTEGSLTGTYSARWGEPLVRAEDSLFYGDADAVQNLPRLGSDVLYEGSIEPFESGEYRFLLYYAGYVKLFIDNEEIVAERWRTAWNPNSYKFSVNMQKGKKYNLRVEWKPDGGSSYIGLRAYAPVADEIMDKITMWNEMVPQSDYYFIASNNMDGVIGGLRSLVGKANIMPKWAMGFWQSRERYTNQNEVVATLKTFRDKGIGIDNIVQDWNYWEEDSWGAHDFDPARFPDPQGMMDAVHEMNAQLMISVWPKFYHTTEHYKEFDENGWMFTRAVEDSIRDWIGPGYIGSFYDAYSEGARQLFWQQMKEHLYKYGIDAWWMDASEPNIRDCVPLSYQKLLCGPTGLGSSTEYLNGYALMNAKAIYEGLREEEPDKRVFQLTRSGFAGLQRYSTASWSGDIGTRWEDMRSQIVAGMNFSLCGDPYWTMDIGGFCVENRYANAQREFDRTGVENADLTEWRELQTRWYQFGTFTPIYRAHGQFPLREVWNIAPENHPAYKSIVYYNKLRYKLMPYIYSLAGSAYHNDYTLMRGLVMDYANDNVAMNVSDQFMLGPSLMICPVYEYKARSREVYLPKGKKWYNFNDEAEVIEGGKRIVADAPYELMPIYIPSGAIIAYGPEIEYVDQIPATEITLKVYAGNDGSFTLYEDDGESFDYENGKYSIIPISYNDTTKSLTISERRGEYDGMLKERVFVINYNDNGTIKTTRVDYSGKELKVAL